LFSLGRVSAFTRYEEVRVIADAASALAPFAGRRAVVVDILDDTTYALAIDGASSTHLASESDLQSTGIRFERGDIELLFKPIEWEVERCPPR
jgi:hypothetical protein